MPRSDTPGDKPSRLRKEASVETCGTRMTGLSTTALGEGTCLSSLCCRCRFFPFSYFVLPVRPLPPLQILTLAGFAVSTANRVYWRSSRRHGGGQFARKEFCVMASNKSSRGVFVLGADASPPAARDGKRGV